MEKGNSHSYNKKQQAGAHTSSSCSFTTDLFGPKDRSKSSASSAGLFVSVFGESSMGRESSQSGAHLPVKLLVTIAVAPNFQIMRLNEAGTARTRVRFITLNHQNHAISAHRYIMVAKIIIHHPLTPLALSILSRKTGEKMTKMETIQTVLLGETGGKARYITEAKNSQASLKRESHNSKGCHNNLTEQLVPSTFSWFHTHVS
nr:RNA-binding protein like [Ipomoea batatas]GME13560.1 RNA-binding protein like [Ipomoea batatas]